MRQVKGKTARPRQQPLGDDINECMKGCFLQWCGGSAECVFIKWKDGKPDWTKYLQQPLKPKGSYLLGLTHTKKSLSIGAQRVNTDYGSLFPEKQESTYLLDPRTSSRLSIWLKLNPNPKCTPPALLTTGVSLGIIPLANLWRAEI